MSRPFAIGIDGGGSKTEALLLDLDSGAALSVFAGGINSIADGIEPATRQLELLIGFIRDAMLREDGRVASVCIGSAAITDDNDGAHWSVRMLEAAFPQARTQGATDGRIALEGALGDELGAVVIAGTGSIGIARGFGSGAAGSIVRCGGWGPRCGDEGSGYWIGCEALRAVAMDMDGRGQSTLLMERLRSRLRFAGGAELIERIYGWKERAPIAELAIDVAACAAERDEASLAILDEAGRHLALHLLTLIRRFEWAEGPRLSYAGGVFRMGEPIVKPLRRHLGEWGGLLRPPAATPARGAARLAAERVMR